MEGYLGLSAKIFTFISLGLEEKAVVSDVWSLLTKCLTSRTDRPTHQHCVPLCPHRFFTRQPMAICGKMLAYRLGKSSE